jgi:hypothetical protein
MKINKTGNDYSETLNNVLEKIAQTSGHTMLEFRQVNQGHELWNYTYSLPIKEITIDMMKKTFGTPAKKDWDCKWFFEAVDFGYIYKVALQGGMGGTYLVIDSPSEHAFKNRDFMLTQPPQDYSRDLKKWLTQKVASSVGI